MTQHISALLYRYQCVIVPGFGAFITEIQSSFYDAEKQLFFPPEKRISFNKNIVNNDGLLMNHISLEEGISHDEAMIKINDILEDWNSTLQSFGTLHLDSVGSFQLNEEKNLVFEPIKNQNYLATSFGLSSVGVNAIEREASNKVVSLHSPANTAKSKTKFNFFKYASVVVLTLGIGNILVQNGYTAYVNDQTLSIENNVQNKIQDKLQQATFVIEPSIDAISLPVESIKEESLNYHIVASAFRNEENAAIEVQKLKAKGYENASFLEKNKYGMYPVLYGSFATHDQAKESLRKIHNTVNREAWIFIK